MPASVNKLYTTSAALERYGAEGQLNTEVLGDSHVDDLGVVDGNLYLRGGGDPSFSRAEARGLARVLAGSGLTEVDGRVIGDESRFDSVRGGPGSNYGVSSWVGPLSGLPFNHGYTLAKRPRFQRKPPLYAAQRFERELEARRRRRAARRPGRDRAGGRRPARRVGVAADVRAREEHQPAVRQLHGRDAAQGARGRLRRRRDDRGGRRGGARPRGASTAPSRRWSTAPA